MLSKVRRGLRCTHWGLDQGDLATVTSVTGTANLDYYSVLPSGMPLFKMEPEGYSSLYANVYTIPEAACSVLASIQNAGT